MKNPLKHEVNLLLKKAQIAFDNNKLTECLKFCIKAQKILGKYKKIHNKFFIEMPEEVLKKEIYYEKKRYNSMKGIYNLFK